jgi:hypothetical protein
MPNNRSVRIALAVFVVIHAILLFSMRLLPFVDLPNHLTEAAVYKYNGTEGLIGQNYQAVPAFYPNTFHTVFCSLFPSVEFGNKVFYVLYVFLLLWSVYLVVRELKGNLWYGLLSVLFIYNFNTTFGFTGFTIAIPTLILVFYLALRDARQPRFSYTIGAAVLMVMLYLMHAQMALFGLLLYGLMMLLAFWKRFGLFLLKGIVAGLPVIIMVAVWWSHRTAGQQEESTLDFLARYYRNDYLPEFQARIRLFIFDHLSLTEGRMVPLLLNFCVILPILIALFFYGQLRKLWRRELLFPGLFLLISLGCFIVLPRELPGQNPLFERFSTLVFLSLILVGSVLLKDVKAKWLPAFVVVAGLAYTALWGEYMQAFNRENRSFNAAFFQGVKPEGRMAGLVYENRFRGREVYIHFPNYNLVWNQGLTASKAIDYRFGVIRRTEKNPVPFYHEWIGREYTVPAGYADSLEYLIQRGAPPVTPDANTAAFRLVRQSDKWSLLERRN